MPSAPETAIDPLRTIANFESGHSTFAVTCPRRRALKVQAALMRHVPRPGHTAPAVAGELKGHAVPQ
jgi:hypothetical protein